MSVIQDALKKAQRQREQKKSATPYDNAAAKSSNTLMYVAVGALCCTIVIVLAVVFSSPSKRSNPISISKVSAAPAVVSSPIIKPAPVPSAVSSVGTDKQKIDKKKQSNSAVESSAARVRKMPARAPAAARTEPPYEPSAKPNVLSNVLNPDTVYNEALEQQRAGRLSQARTLYLKVLSIQPNHLESLNNLGIIAGQSGDSRGAISYFRKALDYNKNYSKAYNNIGLISMNEGNQQLAEEYFSKAISLQPGDAEPYVNLSALFKGQNKLAEAERTLRDAMRRRVEDPSITLSYAVVKDNLGDYEEAALYYRRYLSSARNPASMRNIIERLQYIEQSKSIK